MNATVSLRTRPLVSLPDSTTAGALTLFAVWCDFKRIKKLKRKTLIDYEKRLSKVSEWLDMPVSEITKDMVIVKHQAMSETCPANANLVFKVLRSLLNYAEARFDAGRNPVRILSAIGGWNRIDRRKTFIKPEDLARWFETVLREDNSVYKDYLITMVLTGLRKTECSMLAWEPVDKEHGVVDLRRRTIYLPDSKSNREHILPIPNYLFEVLTLRLLGRRRDSVYVFPGKITGRPLSEFNRSYERIVSRSGVDFSPHDLRRTFSSMAQYAGIEKEMIRKLLNHKDSDVTDGYIIYWAERYKEPMQKIENCILQWAGLQQPD